MKENYTPLTQTPLSVSNTAVDEKINAITPNEEYVPSTGRQLLGMGIEIGGGMISEVVAPFAAAAASIPTLGAGAAPAYVGTKYSFGVGASYLAQIVEGHPEWRHGRAQFAGGANIVPFGSTVRKTKEGVGLFSKVMAGRVTKTALKGSTISTASITGERVIDDGRLPTLQELGFAAAFGGALGAGFDIGSVKVGEKFLPVWDKMTDGMKGTFLKVAGKSPQEIREQITKGKISRDEFRTLRDQLVDDAYKDAGFFDGFMGNKKIDVNSLKPSQRLDYVKNRLQYLDELNEDVIDNLEDGILDVKEFRAQTKPIAEEIQALRLREEELTKLARETPTVKPESERPVSPEEVIEEAVDEIDEPAPRQTPEAEETATSKPKPEGEAPVPPKETPEPTEKERIIELAEQLMGRKDILDSEGNKIGLTAKVSAQKTEELVDAFKAYKTKVVDALTQRTEGGDYDADELIKLLDDYAEIAPAKFEVDNKDGNVLRVRGEGATADEVQDVISKRKQDELAAIYALRDAVKRDRDEPLDVDNLESLRKRIMGEVDDEVATTGAKEGSNKPKPTSQERRVTSLEEQLNREREVFTGQRDPSDPKAPVTSPRIRELEAQIKFYRTASNEAAEVAELQEKNKLLYAMVSGQDVTKIDENLGIHPKFRPDYANKKKMTGHLEFLRQQNKRLQEEARKVQKDAALAQADKVLNPDLYATSKLDRGIAKFEEITTGLLLDSPLTGTAGLVSNTVAMLTRPMRDTVGGYMWRNLPLKEKRIYRQALYRFANILAYKDIVTGFFDVSNISNAYGAAKNRGQNPMFPKARVRLDETTQKPRAKNQRAIDKARARQKRRDKGDGLNNALMRIKAAEITGDVVMELTLFGRTMLGVMDVPFANAVTKSRLYAEALRDAIRNEATDIQAHVKKYTEEAYTVQNGRKVWAYKERDLDIINEYREALLMPRDLKDGDIRKTVMERVTESVDSQTGAGTIFGRVIQLMFPVRTTGSIATGLISNTVGAVPIAVGRFGAKGLAKLSPDSKFVSKTRAGVVAKTQNNVNRYRKIIREGVDDKGVTLTEESKAQIQNQLNVEETRLAKLTTQMEEVDRKTIGNVLMFAAYFITAWNLIDEDEEEGITGSGAHFDRKQRKDSNFQPYKFIYDDGKSMVDYRMSDPDKALLAFVADVKAYHVAKKNNEIPEDSTQSLTKTIRRSAFQILTDNPYMTGARNASTLMNAETDDDRLLRVFTSLVTSRFSPPSFIRHINQNDDVYVPDNLQSKPKDMTIDRMFGLEPANVRRYETGAPMYLPEKDIWNLIIRSARTKKRARSYQEVYDILETDGRRTNIVGSLAPTHEGIKTKDYWNEDGQTLYDAFGEFIYNYMPTKPIEVGDKTYRNLRLEEVMYDIITDPSWDDKYNDVKTDGYVYPDELFDAKGNLKNVSKQSNEGLEELQRVRLAYIRAASDEFFKRDTLKNFKNSDGMTPQEQIAETANRITD